MESEDKDSTSFTDTLIDDTDLSKMLEQDFKFEQIQKAIQELDNTNKDIIHLKFIEEKSNEEISGML